MSDESPFPSTLLSDDEPISEDDWGSLLAESEAEARGAAHAQAVGSDSEPKRWTIESDADAQWAMARFAELTREVDQVAAKAQQWRDQVTDWETAACREPARRATFLERQLVQWGMEKRAAYPKQATFPLVAGRVKTRYYQPEVDIADDAAVIEWAKANGRADLVVTVEKIGVRDLRRVSAAVEQVVESFVQLDCGHQVYVNGKSAVGEVVACHLCPTDALSVVVDGDNMVPVTEVLEERVDLSPVSGDSVIPGARVNPARTTVTVETY